MRDPPAGRAAARSRPTIKRYRSSGVTNPLLRGPARLAEAIALLPQVRRRLPGAKLPFERPRVLTSMIAGSRGRAVRARLAPARPGRAGARRRARLARAGRCRAAQLRARRVPRRRAHHDRDVRARRGPREGARALRLAPGRPAARDAHDRQRPRRPRAGAVQARRARPRLARRARRLDRDLLLDGAQPGPPAVEGARASRATRSSIVSPPRSRRPSSSKSPRPRWRPAWSSNMATETRTRKAPPARDLRPPGREDAGGLLHRRVLQPCARGAARGRSASAGRHAGLPEASTRTSAGWTRRSRCSSSARTTGSS